MIKRDTLFVTTNLKIIFISNIFIVLVNYVSPTDGSLQIVTNFTVTNLSPSMVIAMPNNRFQAILDGSVTLIIEATINNVVYSSTINLNIFPFLQYMSQDRILYTLRQELPTSYTSSTLNTSGHYLDVYATSVCLNEVYKQSYDIVDNILVNNYNKNWELAFNGSKNLFLNGKMPSSLLKLLYQIPSETGITQFDLLLFIARFAFYWYNQPVIVWLDGNIIRIGIDEVEVWELDVPGKTELGETTILGGEGGFLFQDQITNIINRLFPVWYGYQIIFQDQSITDPVFKTPFTDYLEKVGFTYRENYNQDIIAYQYTGDNAYPNNIVGYKLI